MPCWRSFYGTGVGKWSLVRGLFHLQERLARELDRHFGRLSEGAHLRRAGQLGRRQGEGRRKVSAQGFPHRSLHRDGSEQEERQNQEAASGGSGRLHGYAKVLGAGEGGSGEVAREWTDRALALRRSRTMGSHSQQKGGLVRSPDQRSAL